MEVIVTSAEQLTELIEKAIEKRLPLDLNNKDKTSPDIEYLTPEQVAQRLSISLVTLWNYDQKGITKPLRVGNLKRYRKNDLDSIFEAIPVIKARKRGRKKGVVYGNK